MDEVFSNLGKVVVDHVGNIGHVDSAGGHVGSNEHAMVTLFKAAKSGVALRLRTVAMNLCGRPAGTSEFPRYATCSYAAFSFIEWTRKRFI
jgi:hypothetical protein